MSSEQQIIADAAQRFAQALQAERAATVRTLTEERTAAQQVLRALREEYGRQRTSAGLSFVAGVVIGAAVGVALIALLNPRSGAEQRQALAQRLAQARIGARWQAAWEAGRRAGAATEAELWQEYRRRTALEQPD